MTVEQFEQKLDDLITTARDAELSWDSIISTFELKTMALREEAEQE